MEMQATVNFDQPFMLTDGYYNMTVSLLSCNEMILHTHISTISR